MKKNILFQLCLVYERNFIEAKITDNNYRTANLNKDVKTSNNKCFN